MILTTSEAAKRLGCSPDNVRKLEREGKLRADKTSSGQRLFQGKDVEKLAQSRAKAREQKAAKVA